MLSLAVHASGGNPAADSLAPVVRTTLATIDLAKARPSNEPLFDPANLEAAQNVPVGETIAQIVAMPESAFNPFSAAKHYPLDAKTALWLHFRVIEQAPHAQTGWIFTLPKSFLDRVEFYYRNPAGAWVMDMAGDQLPQQQWSMRGVYPQFQLPPLAFGINDFYVKVQHLTPLRIAPSLKSAAQSGFETQNQLLVYGVLFGFLAFMCLLASVLSVVYRRSIYACYAVYLVLAFLSVTAHVGIGHYALWPRASWWSEQAAVVCLMAALTTQLQFCRAMFINAAAAPWMNRITLLAIAVSAAATARYLWLPIIKIELRSSLMLTSFLISGGGALYMTIRAALQSSAVAKLWLLANVPTFSILALTLIEQYGLAPIPWLPYDAMLYALGYEASVLLVALHLHVKTGHERAVRSDTLADVDPLTGFVAPRQFPKLLAEAWATARQQRRDLSVVYIQANFKAGPLPSVGSKNVEAAALRCVRILRTVSREADTVARVHANLFAILMPGVSPGENLNAKLSRMIALGVMTDRDDPLSEPIKLRVAASARSRFSGTAQQLDVLMRERLASDSESETRSINYVTG